MKVTLKETCESDGNWYKILVNGLTKACIKKDTELRTNNEALTRANQIFAFYYENNGEDRIIKEFEIPEV